MKSWAEFGKVWILYIIANNMSRLVYEVSPVIGALNHFSIIIAFIIFVIGWTKRGEDK